MSIFFCIRSDGFSPHPGNLSDKIVCIFDDYSMSRQGFSNVSSAVSCYRSEPRVTRYAPVRRQIVTPRQTPFGHQFIPLNDPVDRGMKRFNTPTPSRPVTRDSDNDSFACCGNLSPAALQNSIFITLDSSHPPHRLTNHTIPSAPYNG